MQLRGAALRGSRSPGKGCKTLMDSGERLRLSQQSLSGAESDPGCPRLPARVRAWKESVSGEEERWADALSAGVR